VPTIVPRWEWRSFGESFGAAERMLTAQRPERVHETDELYLLSPDSDASVKIRDALMDVKQLEDVNADGLERWRPVMKAAFPLAADEVDFVLGALHVGVPPGERRGYGPGDVAALALTAEVHKQRAHYRIDGCLAELTEVRVGERATHTLAVEGEDPDRVIAAVRRLGLEGRRNVSVARGLKALLGVGAQRFAAIDVGTNSVKLHVAARSADGAWRTLADRSEVTRLGEGLHESGQLGAEPIRRTTQAIAALAGEARALGAAEIVAVGTAGLRIAGNADDLIAAARAACDVTVEVIPGEEEARLAFVAATAGFELAGKTLVVFDTGGGSSQFTIGEEQFSVDVGAVRLTERFGLDEPVPAETVAAAQREAAAGFARLEGNRPTAVIGMGGAVTNLAAMALALEPYDPDVVHGSVLGRAEVDAQIERLRALGGPERRAIVGLQPARAEVILAGACVVRAVLDVLRADALTVSDRALRHGLIADRFGT